MPLAPVATMFVVHFRVREDTSYVGERMVRTHVEWAMMTPNERWTLRLELWIPDMPNISPNLDGECVILRNLVVFEVVVRESI